ncbi:StbA family protein [Cronobacter turicensis]|uniref:plasmid segregation protein ParM domain-containing protein n=1 Tax=Cronobacter dublinensis TaxID=413497 RepID=UPI0013756EA4|nr:plasmid segregation protein ParM domain-containing protein [Cronobacter dublinensis]ELY4112145.1 StbA family protein [Cronobacter turicensis]ELZ8935164.1 StbA family protein [Cronobacter dublinensis]EMA8648555.1 StbA family protein [Cronobacter turicensis]NCH98001.1 StbA family protein [Cronobacter dublinensis]
MNIYCDDGSTNVKLAWFMNGEIQTTISPNSFRHGWKVADLVGNAFNYQVGPLRYSWDSVSRDAVPTTNVEYQYGDLNLLAVHHALLKSGLPPQPVSITVTLPLSEYYDQDCQKNEQNIQRKRDNLMRELRVNKREGFTITDVTVMPESLPAAFSRLAQLSPGPAETTLIIDLGGTTLDAGVIVGQFDDISAVHGNPGIGVSSVTRAAHAALRIAETETSSLIADEVIRRRKDRAFLNSIINDSSRIDYVVEKIEEAVITLGALVTNELARYRSVNRVLLVGGGAPLIENAVRQAWPLADDRIEIISEPQLALAREIALYRQEG